eukprot:CAMPEP_0204357484 /NCGR_PEP_ID=MMETSP0469-20131031/35769_1 /ASSEMBLY_ACC=CAM_ASM_000384 /TAXON_ID=2969 /ORGANISM="Oxyrrhis marina" /LENGTH=39 /DNA_ID= /DNA_START= /DNA_END= /DNA_ORIENTATION=
MRAVIFWVALAARALVVDEGTCLLQKRSFMIKGALDAVH